MRQTILVLALMLTLTVSVCAGDMHCGVADTPQPSSIEQTTGGDMPSGADGEMGNGVTTNGEIPFGQSEAVTQAALSLCQSVLSLF